MVTGGGVATLATPFVPVSTGSQSLPACYTSGAKGKLYVVFGREGAGKTQTTVPLAEMLSVPLVSTGNNAFSVLDERHPHYRDLRRVLTGEELAILYAHEKGRRLPNSIVRKTLTARLAMPDCAQGVLLEGIREASQTSWVEEDALKMGFRIHALELVTPDDVILERIRGRRVCHPCNRTYHIVHTPPKREGSCDRCGGDLDARNEDTVNKLLGRWSETAEDLRRIHDHYKRCGCLSIVSGDGPPDQVVYLAHQLLTQPRQQ